MADDASSSMAGLMPPAYYSAMSKYRGLECPKGRIMVMYVFVDDYGILRCKTKMLDFIPKNVSEVPPWNYAWLTSIHADPCDSDFALIPVAMFPDPFRRGDHKLVFCTAREHNGRPRPRNYRDRAVEILSQAEDEKPWFGIEQEYVLLDTEGRLVAWPANKMPDDDNHLPHYCGVGGDSVFARNVVEAHNLACLYAGINIYGSVAEAFPAQFEYQVGPCEGISIGDHLWMSRFILLRVAEDFGLVVNWHPKPEPKGIDVEFVGSGGHMNFSTKAMREEGGMEAIDAAVEKLSKRHMFHQKCYDNRGGEENRKRMTGENLTAAYDTFFSGVGHRGASVRIPKMVAMEGKGYLEDRRPAANADPYKVAAVMVATICLDSHDDHLFPQDDDLH